MSSDPPVMSCPPNWSAAEYTVDYAACVLGARNTGARDVYLGLMELAVERLR